MRVSWKLCVKITHCMIVGFITSATFTLGIARPTSPRYTLNRIERILKKKTHLHLVTEYELGEVNWTSRLIHVLGVGTHTVLSPTGGWGQTDLQELAIENARQKLERLSAELYQNLSLSGCHWGSRSQMFQSPKVQWMSDGSVHLPSVIRFEIYEHCQRSRLEQNVNVSGDQTSTLKRAQDRKRTALQKTLLLRKIEDELQTQSRAIIFADFKRDAHARVFASCLSPTPRLSLQAQAASLEAQEWRAIRWIWSSSSTSLTPAQKPMIKPHPPVVESTMRLGEIMCLQDSTNGANPILQPKKITAQRAQKLRDLVKSSGGAELWIWVHR